MMTMRFTLIALVVSIAAALIMGAILTLGITGNLVSIPLNSLPDAVLSLEITEKDAPLAVGRFIVTRPDFFDQQIAVGVLDNAGTAKIPLKAGVTYKISVHRKDNSLCRAFNVELMEGAAISLSCIRS